MSDDNKSIQHGTVVAEARAGATLNNNQAAEAADSLVPESLSCNPTISRKDFETLLVEAPCLRNKDEAIVFDLAILGSRPTQQRLIRPFTGFEVPPSTRHSLFLDGREVFVSVERHCKDSLVYGVISVPTDVLKSEQKTLPVTLHQLWELLYTEPHPYVNLDFNELFRNESDENN